MVTYRADRLNDQHRDYTRTRLVEAATSAFEDKGYVAVTISDIVERVGCSRATFYLHFDSKVSVMEAVLDAAWPGTSAAARRLDSLAAKGISHDQTRSQVGADVVRWQGKPGLLKAMLVASFTEPELSSWLKDKFAVGVEGLHNWLMNFEGSRRAEKRARFLLLQNMSLVAYATANDSPEDFPDDVLIDYLCELWSDVLSID